MEFVMGTLRIGFNETARLLIFNYKDFGQGEGADSMERWDFDHILRIPVNPFPILFDVSSVYSGTSILFGRPIRTIIIAPWGDVSGELTNKLGFPSPRSTEGRIFYGHSKAFNQYAPAT
jgi:hypothetical protein